MIKAVGRTPAGELLLILGLTAGNWGRLRDNQPILIKAEDMAALGVRGMEVIILGGDTEESIVEDLRALGLLP